MATDFSYNEKTINSGGPIKPSGINQPLDPRTEVKLYADIKLIPNPYVGMIITVLEDETNSNKMTDYKVLSLKSDDFGVANSVVDRVQRYVEYLGVSTGESSSSGTGLTSEQEEQLNKIPEMEASINNINETLNTKANTSDIPTNTSELYNDSGFLTSIPSEYVTETEMNEAIASISSGYATKDELNTKANISDIPTKTSNLINDSGFVTNSSLSSYVLTSEINGLVEDALQGATVTSKSKVNYSSAAYNPNYNSIEIESGSAINIIFSIPEYTTRRNFFLSCSTNDISFSGSDYSNQGFSFINASGLSKTITFTAASNITSKRYCYIYVAPYEGATNSAYDCFKIRFIISPASDSSVTYGDIVVNNTTSSINEGQTFTYTINLSQSPTNEQVVNITTTNNDVTVNPTSLTFTSSNYNTPQTVTVTVAQDSDTSSDDCQITMASTGVTSQSFNIQINDTDVSEPEVTSYTITKNLTNVSISNTATSANENSSYSATLTANSGYELSTVTITMGGADITSSSYSNGTITIPNVTGNIVITANATQQASNPNPDETVAIDNLIVHFDGRDVEEGSTQAYWTNRVSGKSISNYEITSQFGTPNSGWNDSSRTYGWLGDSFRYYLVGGKQPQVTISEIADNYSVSICLLQEDYTKYMGDYQKTAYRLWATTAAGDRHELLLDTDGTVNLKFGNKTNTNLVADDTFKITPSGANVIIHHTTTVDFTNNKLITYVNGVKQSELVLIGDITNPRNLLQLASGGYTVPIRMYYFRVYNTVLTPEEVSTLYNQEKSIVRSV